MPIRSLTNVGRLILANQYAILEKLDTENADVHASTRSAIENGYEMHCSWLTQHIMEDDDAMTTEECHQVAQTLKHLPRSMPSSSKR